MVFFLFLKVEKSQKAEPLTLQLMHPVIAAFKDAGQRTRFLGILVRETCGAGTTERRTRTEEIGTHAGSPSDRVQRQVHRLFNFGAIGTMSDGAAS